MNNYGFIELGEMNIDDAFALAGELFDENGFRSAELGIDVDGEFTWIYAKKAKILYVYFQIDGSVQSLIDVVRRLKREWTIRYDTRTEYNFRPIYFAIIRNDTYVQYPLCTEHERNAYEKAMAYGMKGKLGLNLCNHTFDSYSRRRCMLSTL